MAAMKDDVFIADSWVSAHALSELDASKGLTLQNKGMFPVLMFISDSMPADSSVSGFRLLPDQVWSVDAGEPRTWLRVEAAGQCPVCIQEKS